MPTQQPRPGDEQYVPSASGRTDGAVHVLKRNDAFAAFDRFGDIEPGGPPEAGIYDHDTRFLSRSSLRLAGVRPVLLGSGLSPDGEVLTVDLMNPELRDTDGHPIPRGAIHMRRTKLLWDGACFERLRIHNYEPSAVELSLTVDLEADFADLFEVRGLTRLRHGRHLPPSLTGDGLRYAYDGLDGVRRETVITFDPPPDRLQAGRAGWDVRLEPGSETTWETTVRCERSSGESAVDQPRRHGVERFDTAAAGLEAALRSGRDADPRIVTSDERFNTWLARSFDDLRLLRTETPHGPFPYAGIPWFSAPFGRDGIITALEALWIDPGLARGVLAYLAATQSERDDPDTEAEPGKILHEARAGEMAVTGEVPFARYYGSADATPLFVMLAGAYLRATGDLAFAAEIWPNVRRALAWMEDVGDADGDGFLEYGRRSSRGLPHQGWRDAHDAVFHADGSLAAGPIALSELQGYAYAARLAAAELARALDEALYAAELEGKAEALRLRFDAAFWCEELGSYAMALDGEKRACRVRASSAGHCLYAGIASDERAARLSETLMDPSSFSGWGIRTVAAGQARYSPIAYHNGSVWPHDSAIVAAGLARYGMRREAARILGGLFEAAGHFPGSRLPELFCGFEREPGEPPIGYPVACSPQAWAAAAPFLLLQGCLGLEVGDAHRRVTFDRPHLPDGLTWIRIERLRVGDTPIDVELRGHGEDVTVDLRQDGT